MHKPILVFPLILTPSSHLAFDKRAKQFPSNHSSIPPTVTHVVANRFDSLVIFDYNLLYYVAGEEQRIFFFLLMMFNQNKKSIKTNWGEKNQCNYTTGSIKVIFFSPSWHHLKHESNWFLCKALQHTGCTTRTGTVNKRNAIRTLKASFNLSRCLRLKYSSSSLNMNELCDTEKLDLNVLETYIILMTFITRPHWTVVINY